MRILVGHERFGHVRNALRRRGHQAWSCDKLPAVDASPFHIESDVEELLYDGWDAGIFFPDCTFLTVSGAWAFGDGPYHQKVKPETIVGARRREARTAAIAHVIKLRSAPINRIAIENPAKSFLCKKIGRPTQVIHPNMFGHDASKETGLWLKEFKPLRPTLRVPPRMIDGKPRWANQTDSGQNKLTPSDDRASKRGETYLGIADAMADQWF